MNSDIRYARFVNSTEDIVLDYFHRIKSGNIHGLLDLFYDDAVIYEPFSKLKCVLGKSDIEAFLRTVLLANAGMQQEIDFVKGQEQKANNDNRVVALIKFHKGNSITGRFTFEFEARDSSKRQRIKALNIEFV